MVSTLFNQFSFCVSNNGFTSKLCNKARGVNQGCPASPQVWILTGELLVHLINKEREKGGIRGIEVKFLKDILSQFADDTGAFLNYDANTLNSFCNCLRDIETNIGLKVSYDKTTLYRIGSLYNTSAECYTTKQLSWSDGPMDSLGITINCDGTLNPQNFEEIINKMNSICKNWYNRQLTLIGRVLVANTLLSSLFVYKMLVLVDMSADQLKTAERILVDFIWKGKSPKIALKTLRCTQKQGRIEII